MAVQRELAMPSYHDLISLPAKGRYFAYPHGPLRNLLREFEFSPLITNNRFVLHYKNDLRLYSEGQGVGVFKPPNAFCLNSFAEDVDTALAEHVTRLILEEFRAYDRQHRPAKPSPKHVTSVANYCDVYFDAREQKLLVVERIVHRSKLRFRSRAKFCHAFKSAWQTMKRAVIKELALSLNPWISSDD